MSDYTISPFINPQLEDYYSIEDRAVYHSGYFSQSLPQPHTKNGYYYHQSYHDIPSTNNQLPPAYSDYDWTHESFGYSQGQFVQNITSSSDVPRPTDELPLHAPVPLPGYTPLLSHTSSHPEIEGSSSIHCNRSPYPSTNPSAPMVQHQQPCTSFKTDDLLPFPQHQEMLEFYAKASEQTFPTPSELLSQLTGMPLLQSPPGFASNTTLATVELEKKVDSQRKARHRAVADSVGFEPTDPDIISSHDKKRNYLECLESYVKYLRGQLSLVDDQSPPERIERITTYRGLNTQSIRTLLVHMENTARNLHLQTEDEEKEFLRLRARYMAQDAGVLNESPQH